MTTSLRTPLYDWHVAHGGRMVEFAGFQMPVQYSGIVDEHASVRTAAGLFDISHMGRLSFSGSGVFDFLQHIYTNNVATMKDMQVRYGLICNAAGGIRDDVLIYKWPYGYSMVVNASNRTKIIDHMQAHRAGRDVQWQDQTLETAMIALQGPKAMAMCQGLTEYDPAQLAYYFAMPTRCLGQPCILSRTGYTGEDGVEIMIGSAHVGPLCDELLKRGAKLCGLGARDTLRLEAAMPLYGHELNEDLDPIQAGLSWAVKFDKGDFVGRDAMLQRKANPARRVRVGLEATGKRPPREGYAVLSATGEIIGNVTSGTFAPTLQKSIGMAYVDSAYAAVGTSVQFDARGKPEPATIVKLPFYKRAN